MATVAVGNGQSTHLNNTTLCNAMKKVVIYLQKGLFRVKQANKLFGRKQEQEMYIATDEVLFV